MTTPSDGELRPLAEHVGADLLLGSALEMRDGVATGRLVEPFAVRLPRIEDHDPPEPHRVGGGGEERVMHGNAAHARLTEFLRFSRSSVFPIFCGPCLAR